MSYKYIAGDIVLSGSDGFTFPNKADASVDLASAYILSATGARGTLTITSNGTTANGAVFTSPASNLIVLSNSVVDEGAFVALTCLSSSHSSKAIGLTAAPYLTVDNQYQFMLVNSSGTTVANDTEIKMSYIIIN